MLENEREFIGIRSENNPAVVPPNHGEPDDGLVIIELRLDVRARKADVSQSLDLNHLVASLNPANFLAVRASGPSQSGVITILPNAAPESSSSCAARTSESLKRLKIDGRMAPSAR